MAEDLAKYSFKIDDFTPEAAAVSLRDTATFVGELYHIAGAPDADAAKVRINTESHGVVFCTTTREVAKTLRDFLFEQIKVNGRGLWTKTEDGWSISDFTLTDFVPIKKESLREAVDRIRAQNIAWPSDPLGELRELEEKTGQPY